ncbi:MAG: PH domain-containing protein [Thermoplasmata archaeon]|nr:PH domain-containing protein [Thermoplasmata archaeon]MCI4333456.1 PH domain-containing protein [Thermoplasmata archaeon]
MYCNRCGTLVPDDAAFCQRCGAAMGRSGTGAAATPLPNAPSGGFPGAGFPPPPPPLPGRPGSSRPGAVVLRPIPIPPDLPFHPQEDEVIYREIVPDRKLLWRLALGGLLSGVVILFLVVPFGLSFLFSGVGGNAVLFAVVFLIVVFLLIVTVSFVYAFLAFHKFRYWITNHRTVGRRGAIGFSIDSIPLETISDVVVQRSIADRILGLSSIWVQPFGGGSVGGYGAAQYRFGALSGSNSFLGLLPAEATDIQQLIFHLRDVRRRETGRLI